MLQRVLIVDDSAFMRRVIRDLINAMPGFVVCAAVRDAEAAIEAVRTVDPDLITLDVSLPGRDGLELLRWIMTEAPRPVVMLSGVSSAGARETVLRALELGAIEFVRKPSGPISLDLASVGEALHQALSAAAASRVQRSATAAPRAVSSGRLAAASTERVVVVAASTGGPAALVTVLAALPATLAASIVIVQHMPAGFTESFAERLDRVSALPVRHARVGDPIRTGRVLLAPGDRHVRLRRTVTGGLDVELDAAPPRCGARPCADYLFESAAERVGAGAIGVILTGMGRDGVDGLRAIRHAGGGSVVQDGASAVVDGMPGTARREVGCDEVASIDQMADAIVRAVGRADRRCDAA